MQCNLFNYFVLGLKMYSSSGFKTRAFMLVKLVFNCSGRWRVGTVRCAGLAWESVFSDVYFSVI